MEQSQTFEAQTLATTVINELKHLGVFISIQGIKEQDLPQNILVEKFQSKKYNPAPPEYIIMPANLEHELLPSYHSRSCQLPTESALLGISISPDSARSVIVEWQANPNQRWKNVYVIQYKKGF